MESKVYFQEFYDNSVEFMVTITDFDQVALMKGISKDCRRVQVVESTIVNNQKQKYFHCKQRKFFIRVAENKATLKKRASLFVDNKKTKNYLLGHRIVQRMIISLHLTIISEDFHCYSQYHQHLSFCQSDYSGDLMLGFHFVAKEKNYLSMVVKGQQ